MIEINGAFTILLSSFKQFSNGRGVYIYTADHNQDGTHHKTWRMKQFVSPVDGVFPAGFPNGKVIVLPDYDNSLYGVLKTDGYYKGTEWIDLGYIIEIQTLGDQERINNEMIAKLQNTPEKPQIRAIESDLPF